MRVVFIDYDGTLSNDGYEVPQGVLRALRHASRVMHLAVLSGRPLRGLGAWWNECQSFMGAVVLNGAAVIGVHGHPVRWAAAIPPGAVVSLVGATNSGQSVTLCGFGRKTFCVLPQGPDAGQEAKYLGWRPVVLPPPAFCQRVFYKITVITQDEDTANLLAEDLVRMRPIAVERSKPRYIEVTARGVDKGHGVTSYTRHVLGASADLETVVIGDSDNDVSAARVVDRCYAVANASPSLRRAADDLLERTNGEGVIDALVKLAKC